MKNYSIFFIRHGITEGNVRGEYTGKTDLPLCEEGEAVIGGYAKAGLYPNVGKVYTSPLKRCVQTAEIIYPGHSTHKVDGLRECDFGGFEGKTPERLSGLPEYKEWLNGGLEARPPGGESHREFTLRCVLGLEEIFTDMGRSEVGASAVVTHAGVIVNLLAGCGLPKGKAVDFMTEQGECWLISMSAYLWQKGNVFEIIGKLSLE